MRKQTAWLLRVGDRDLLEGSAQYVQSPHNHVELLNALESIILNSKLCAIPHRLPCQRAGLSGQGEFDQPLTIGDNDSGKEAWLGEPNRVLRVTIPKEKAYHAGFRIGHELQLSEMVAKLHEHASDRRMGSSVNMVIALMGVLVIMVGTPSTTGGESQGQESGQQEGMRTHPDHERARTLATSVE
jgi:hypothetical protein